MTFTNESILKQKLEILPKSFNKKHLKTLNKALARIQKTGYSVDNIDIIFSLLAIVEEFDELDTNLRISSLPKARIISRQIIEGVDVIEPTDSNIKLL
jgi:hypothetical protein